MRYDVLRLRRVERGRNGWCAIGKKLVVSRFGIVTPVQGEKENILQSISFNLDVNKCKRGCAECGTMGVVGIGLSR